MRISIGADHAGFPLKGTIVELLRALGHETVDLGACDTNPVDYPDFAGAVAESVANRETDRGIVLCGSGVGACIAANKVPGVRAGTCHDTYSAHQGVEHDDMNVLCLGSRIIGSELAKEIVQAFVRASFTREKRHLRRLEKVRAIEQKYGKGPLPEDKA